MTSLFLVTAAILGMLMAASPTFALNATWFCDYPVEDVPTQRELLNHLMEEYSKNSAATFYPEIGFFREKYMHISSCVNFDHLTLSIYDIEDGGKPKAPMPRLWPSKDIPFLIDDRYPDETAGRIRTDMNRISHSTCIRFVDRTDERVFIRFVDPSNNEMIEKLPVYTEEGGVAAPGGADGVLEEIEGKEPGYSGLVRTFIRTNTDIVTRGSGVLPTLMFVLGLKREELRQDRDEYIGFSFRPGDNRTSRMFQKELVTDFDLMWRYDTQSVTHITIEEAEDLNVRLESVDDDVFPIKTRADGVLSEGDIKKINDMYCQPTQEARPEDLVTPVGDTQGPETTSKTTTELTAVTSQPGVSGKVGGVMEKAGGSVDEVLELEEGSSGDGSVAYSTEALEVEGSGDGEEDLESGAVGGGEGDAPSGGPPPEIVSSTWTTSTSTAAPTTVPTTTARTTTQKIFIDTSSSSRPRVSLALALAALLGLGGRATNQAGGV